MPKRADSSSSRSSADAPRAVADDSGTPSDADADNPPLARSTPGREEPGDKRGSGDDDHEKLYFDMLSKVFAGIQEQIRFADTKAGFVAAFNAILVGFIASNLGTVEEVYGKTADWNVCLWLIAVLLATGVPTAISIGLLIWAVRPRTGENTHKSRIFFGHIAQEYKLDGGRYSKDAYSMKQQDWAEDYGRQIVEIAAIADKKHSYVRRSMTFTFWAFVSLVAVSLIIHLISVFYDAGAGESKRRPEGVRSGQEAGRSRGLN